MHCSAPSLRPSRSLVLGTLAGVATWLAAGSASAAAPCNVTEQPDDITLPGSLRYCVDQVNQGLTDEIVIQAFQWYAPDSPLVFERSAHVSGYGRIVMPGDQFVGDDLIVVGTPCPGPTCQGPVEVVLEGVELGAVGFAGVRGIDVLSGHSLVLDQAQMYEFSRPDSGGCIRAEAESSLAIYGSTLEGCMADDGGAVFSEASATTISDSTFDANTASHNGGAIAIGTVGFFARTLSIDTSSFSGNVGAWGGAIKAVGGTVSVEVTQTEFSVNSAVRGGAVLGKGTFEECLFQENTAGAWGGGLYLIEGAAVVDSTLRGNGATDGGGLAFWAGAGVELSFEGSAVAHNVVKGDGASGAGLAVLGGTVNVRNATFSDNVADDTVDTTFGGGLAVLGGKVSVQHATFGDNVATEGGGIYVDAAASLYLDSSIVAYSVGDDCAIHGGYSQTTSMDLDGTCNTDYSGVDPQLDPLDDNGGPTWTRMPQAPEVQDAAVCMAADDQRDQPRPMQDCDVGAVEQ